MHGNPFHPSTVDGGLGRVEAAHVDTSGDVPARRPLSEKEAQRLMLAELLAATRANTASSTALADQLGQRQGTTNGVLEVVLLKFDASGIIVRDFNVPVGSIYVMNHGAAVMTYEGGDQTGNTAPVSGRGKGQISPGKDARIAVGQRGFTLWGTQGDSATVQAFTGLQAFGLVG